MYRQYLRPEPGVLRLFLLRHGETQHNADGIVQGGGIDSDLNLTGLRQSEAFYAFWRQVPFAALYASGLRRTQQTLEPFARNGHPVKRLPQLNEFHWGESEGQRLSDELMARLKPVHDAWERGETHVPVPGGESPQAAWERMKAGLQHIEQQHPEGNVLVCTHGRLLRIGLSQLLGNGLQEMQQFRHHNTGLNILRRTPEGYVAENLYDLSHLNVADSRC